MKRLIEILKDRERLIQFAKENEKQLKGIGIALLLIVAGFAVFASGGDVNESEAADNQVQEQVEETETSTIFVDIGGAVKNPMLAELPEGSRVEDAIIAAGGLTEEADISGINRAEFLEDGSKIYIPSNETDSDSEVLSEYGSYTGQGSSSGKVNINTADSESLQTLNGIGPATAQKIIDYRTDNGRFKSTEDIKNVSGIGDKTFEKLKDDITI